MHEPAAQGVAASSARTTWLPFSGVLAVLVMASRSQSLRTECRAECRRMNADAWLFLSQASAKSSEEPRQ